MICCKSFSFVPPLAIAACLFLCVATAGWAQDRKPDAEVDKLLRERLVILQDVAKLQREQFRTGRSSLLVVLATEKSVAEAELELAITGAERVKVRETLLQNAMELEKAADARAEAGLIPSVERQIAKADRLRAEADLLIERKAAAR